LATRLLRPAANQNIANPKMWQDPVFGYYESHGKMEFKPGEEYNLTDDEKKAVLWRYRVKEILKREYLRREFNPHTFKYKQGVVMDPAMFRWYAMDNSQSEYFQYTPKSTMLIVIGITLATGLAIRVAMTPSENDKQKCLDGELLWWDRETHRHTYIGSHNNYAPSSSGLQWPLGY